MKLINDRYEVLETLGHENSISEYMVRDRKRGNRIKRIRLFDMEISNYPFVDALQHRFVQIKSIEHVNLVPSYEFHRLISINGTRVSRKQFFYTYGNDDEGARVSYLELNRSEVVSVIEQLCRVVRYLHFRGFTYKYLNFSEVFLLRTAAGVVVKLKDLAGTYINDYFFKMDHERFLPFVAPEILWGELVDERADIYALGAMIYYIYYGIDSEAHGFEDRFESVDLNPLMNFFATATNQAQEERFRSMDQFVQSLSQSIGIQVGDEDAEYYNRLQTAFPIVGRSETLSEVKQLMDLKYKKALNKHCIYIFGEEGSGKSRLFKEIYYLAKFGGYPHLLLKPVQSKDPFYSVRSIVDYILKQDDVSPLLIQKYGQELLALSSEAGERWNLKEREDLDLSRQSLRVMNRVYNFLVEYTAHRFLVIVIDDFEKVTSEERPFFMQLLAHKGQSNYFLICTGEDGDLFSRYHQMMVRLKLSALSLEETGQLVRNILGISWTPYELTHRLIIESQGVASIVDRLLRQLYKTGVIYFDKARMAWNLDRVDEHYVFDYGVHETDVLEAFQGNITVDEYHTLRKLSVLEGSFNMNVLFRMADLDEEHGYYFIYEMERRRILNKRISDVEYVFVFTSNAIRKALRSSLTPEEFRMYVEKAMTIYEALYLDKGEMNPYLIEYFLISDMKVLAAQYCLTFSDNYLNLGNHERAVDLLERALAIYVETALEAELVKTARRLIQMLLRLGKLKRALYYTEALMDEIPEGNFEAQADLRIYKGRILLYRLEIEKAADTVAQCEAMPLTPYQSYQVAFLRSQLYSFKSQDATEIIRLLAQARNRAVEMGDEEDVEYLSCELALKGGSDSLEAALDTMNDALKKAKARGNDDRYIEILNDLGGIYVMGSYDYYAARDAFKKAHVRAALNAYFLLMPTLQNNIGETYYLEGRYGKASVHYEASYHGAGEIGNLSVSSVALTNLCFSKLGEERYEKAYTLISKIDHDAQIVDLRDFTRIDHVFLHIAFHFAMNNLMGVKKWWIELEGYTLSEALHLLWKKIVAFKLSYQSGAHEAELEPYAVIEGLIGNIEEIAQAHLIRNCILDLLLDMILKNDFLNAQPILLLDDAMVPHYNTREVRLKRAVIDAACSDFSVQRLEALIEPVKAQSRELLWRVYVLVCGVYYGERNYYDALKYALMALDVIADLSFHIPRTLKETYILRDPVKIELKEKIDRMTYMFLSYEGLSGYVTEGGIDAVETYFDTTQFNRLYQSQRFLKMSHEKLWGATGVEKLENVDLIKKLEKDELSNLKHIIRHLMILTLAERGFIYVLEEGDVISKTIAANDDGESYDIAKLIGAVGSDLDGICISKFDSSTSIQLLSPDQKGLIYFPVYEAESMDARGEKRKEDFLSTKKRIVGYVFLDTGNVINRFNEETFKQIKDFVNLIYVFIDNYNLKRHATTDKLTGVFLRKYIEQIFNDQLATARIYSTQLSVIMLDIDKFKNVNDTYGHRRGDDILTRLGAILMKTVRSSDFVGRYGGEEFIILLPETDAVGGYKVAEKIRRIIKDSRLLGDEMPLTVSLGVSTYPENGVNEEELIERADQALYFSKNNGRNRATSWDEKLIKEGHRYDRLTGLLTGNMPSDTRNMQTMLDIIHQLNAGIGRKEAIHNLMRSILDITEGECLQFIAYDARQSTQTVMFKKRGSEGLTEENRLSPHIRERFYGQSTSHYFIDWEADEDAAFKTEDSEGHADVHEIPNWKSYIVLSFNAPERRGILAAWVPIRVKEFDFTNFNFINTLRPIIEAILFQK